MARLAPEREYSDRKPLIVRRAFVGGGRHLLPGDSVDLRKLLITPRRARQLFEAGYLDHPSEETAQVPQTAPAADPSPPSDQQEPSSVAPPPATEEAPSPAQKSKK